MAENTGAAALPLVLYKSSCSGGNPSSLRWRCERQRGVDSCVDEVRLLIVGEGRGFAYGRNEETDKVVLRLDA